MRDDPRRRGRRRRILEPGKTTEVIRNGRMENVRGSDSRNVQRTFARACAKGGAIEKHVADLSRFSWHLRVFVTSGN